LEVILMTSMLRVPRTRGVASGLLLILLGAWGAVIPFVGPYFHFAYTPDTAWAWTWGRFFLEILPGAAAVLGGLILLISAFRPVAMVGACLAAAGGAWFATGTLFTPLWTDYAALGVRTSVPAALVPGSPTGGPVHIVAERLAFFTGLGVLIVFIAAVALGRLAVIGARDLELESSRVSRDEEPVTVPDGRLPRRRPLTRPSPDEETTTDGEGQRTGVFRRLISARSSGGDES
jgi:hypothetical protein